MKSKPFWKSKSVWLGIVACIYGVVKGLTGGTFSIEELTAVYTGLATIFLRLGIN